MDRSPSKTNNDREEDALSHNPNISIESKILMNSNPPHFRSRNSSQMVQIGSSKSEFKRLDHSISPIRQHEVSYTIDRESDIDDDMNLMKDIELLEKSDLKSEQSVLNKAFIIMEQSEEEQQEKVDEKQDQSYIVKQHKVNRPLFHAENINKQPAFLDYVQLKDKILSQYKFSNIIFITPSDVEEDKINNFRNVRQKILNFLIENQKLPKQVRRSNNDNSELYQYRVNKSYAYYIYNKVAQFHGLDQLFRRSKDYRYKGFGKIENHVYYEVELEDFNIELGHIFFELINSTNCQVNLDDLSYDTIFQLLKWAIKYSIMYPRYNLLSYLIPKIKMRDTIYLFNWSLSECDYFEKAFHQAFQSYLSIFIGEYFDYFLQEFHFGSIENEFMKLSPEKVHKLFYYSLICCEKNNRNKIVSFILEKVYKQSQQQLLHQLSHSFDCSFSYFRSLPSIEIGFDYSSYSKFAQFCKGEHFNLRNDYEVREKKNYYHYLRLNPQWCKIEIDQIEPNSIFITNSIITVSQYWKVVLITDSDYNISIFIYNQGYQRLNRHLDYNQKQINEKFINMTRRSENSFVYLHCKIQMNDISLQFCHPYCIDQGQNIGLCNIMQLKKNCSLRISLTEIPFIASLLNNSLKYLENSENLSPSFRIAILNSNKLEILKERELLRYIESIWNRTEEDLKILYLKTLRVNLIDERDSVTKYQDLNELYSEIKLYKVLYKEGRFYEREKRIDSSNEQENIRFFQNLTKSLSNMTIHDKRSQ